MFLGHVVNMKGIKACPDKAEVVIKLQSPRTLKEVQSLNENLASLNREAVSAVLLTERDLQQMLIYFVNRALQALKIKMEKLVLALVHASRRLKRSSCLEGSGAGLIHTNLEGVEFTYALRFEFEASNDEAEYEALINGSYMAKEQSIIQYLEKAKTLISGFRKFSIEQVPRSENKKEDALSKIASTSFTYLTKQVLVEVLKEKSIEEREILAIVKEEGYCWMKLLLEYLTDGTIPAETKKARLVK
ncbi:reverse transcriptase domain-containing protein [Tanacetum coccineum]